MKIRGFSRKLVKKLPLALRSESERDLEEDEESEESLDEPSEDPGGPLKDHSRKATGSKGLASSWTTLLSI